MIIVGLTGSISCGKSTVCRLIKERDANVQIIDLDAIARALLAPGMPVYMQVVRRYPECCPEPGQELDRERLAAIVFSDQLARRWLDQQTHWRIGFTLLKELIWAWLVGRKIVVVDAPLLFETGLNKMCTSTVAISVDSERQLQRLMDRDKIAREFALQKVRAQMSTEEKCSRASIVIDNNGSLDETRGSVGKLLLSGNLPRASVYTDRRKVLTVVLVAMFVIRMIFK